jgi:hypothetical protein
MELRWKLFGCVKNGLMVVDDRAGFVGDLPRPCVFMFSVGNGAPKGFVNFVKSFCIASAEMGVMVDVHGPQYSTRCADHVI